MKKFMLLCLLVVVAYYALTGLTDTFLSKATVSDNALVSAFEMHKSHVQIAGSGVVLKLLPDDLEGSKHQRFLVRTSTGQVLLLVHNIDIAPRIGDLQVGAPISFYGEYIWSSQGGLIHWTHRDPVTRHPGGWIRYNNTLYH